MSENSIVSSLKKILLHSAIGSILGAIIMIIVSIIKLGTLVAGAITNQAILGAFLGLLITGIRGVTGIKEIHESLGWIILLGLTWAGIGKFIIQPNKTIWEVLADLILGMVGGFILSTSTFLIEVWLGKNGTTKKS